ncbi:isochorismatase family protein [Subtercola lobariae]|uniref:Hydrolase n=1 Tax=Subtercola lobariae TaxID=1588641 RepID=A0A917BBH4_9MICO|nr:isochorismatase family protein [Subtercola lobariae]GGF35899.1 hydrolase [Subtercola lobariae]
MPVTTLDRRTALIVIDLQQGVVALDVVHPVADIVARAVTLADAFREHSLPVVLVTVTGRPSGRTDRNQGAAPTVSLAAQLPAGWADLVPELTPQHDDLLITKQTGSAFPNTGLDTALKAQGVTQVVVVGISTSNGVESTARSAYELGYNVTVAVDAVTDASADHHDHSLSTALPRFAETGTTDEIIALLASTRS